MFKQQAVTKLPTFLQFLKEEELREVDFSSRIVKILWGDKWKSITFQTEQFRYSVKFNSKEEYEQGCREVLDAFQPNAPMSAWVIYEARSGEVEITWVRAEPDDNLEQYQFKQWDWGLTEEQFTPKSPAPASRKKPSAKLTNEAKKEPTPF